METVSRWRKRRLNLFAVALALALSAAKARAKPYPLAPQSLCGSTQTCAAVLDRWNTATWNDLVDDTFDNGGHAYAAVRWYKTEGQCTGTLCNDQLHDGKDDPDDPMTVDRCPTLDATTHHFCGVTDELSNVLLSFAMGSDQGRYEKLRNFAEALREPVLDDLQCWKYYVNGSGSYDHTTLCVLHDSAADASVRILGAYGIACAKQRGGTWTTGATDYCADYVRQGEAVWQLGPGHPGEVKLLANGEYYLAASHANQVSAPTSGSSFRPDYYELQFLMDYAVYRRSAARVQGVLDMLHDYIVSIGTNHIHRGKLGHFDATTSTYTCEQGPITCAQPYMDNVDTWRAIPALSGLANVHPQRLPASDRTATFDFWWYNFAGGHPTLYGPNASKPMEIYSNAADGGVKQEEDSYKSLSAWIPLGAAEDAAYTRNAIDHLVDVQYDGTNEQFYVAAYYGGYFSQFAQRAIGAATGMIDPAIWAGSSLYTVTPCRVFDSRVSPPALAGGVSRTVTVAGVCDIPLTATSVVANVTAISATAQGFLAIWASYEPPPTTSNLSFNVGKTIANNAVLELDDAGQILVRPTMAGSGSVEVIVDVVGYFE